MIEEINQTINGEINEETPKYSAKAQNFETIVDYTTRISNFEGPLDLLLFLVNRAEIEIKDIFVSEVTEQFLEYVNHAADMDIEKESEYLAMAATLLEIKSKALLPQVEFEDGFGEYDYDDDPKRTLIQQLEEFKIYKEASARLKEQETTDRFYKAPDESANEVRIVYTDFNLDGLVKAFTELLAKSDLENHKNDQKEIPKDTFTVAAQIDYIKNIMNARESCSFFELFTKHASKPEIITTFQALLELLKLQYLTVEQNNIFDDITITLREDRSEEVGDLSEYN